MLTRIHRAQAPPDLFNPLGAYCVDDVDQMWAVFRALPDDYLRTT